MRGTKLYQPKLMYTFSLDGHVPSGHPLRALHPILDLRFDPTLENAQHLDDIFQRLREERGETEDEDVEAEEPGPTTG